MQPAGIGKLVLFAPDQSNDEQQDKISAQDHHDAKRIESESDRRNQVGRIFDIPVTEISEVLVQQGTGLLRSHPVFILYRLAIVGKSLDGNPPFPYLLGCRKGNRPFTGFITTFDQVGDTRDISIRITLGKEGQQFRDLDIEKERIYIIRITCLGGVQQSDGDQPRPVTPFVQAFHGGQLHRLLLGYLISGTVTRPYDKYGCGKSENGTDLDTFERELRRPLFQQEPTADTDHEDSHDPPGEHGMEEFVDGDRR